MLEKPGNWRISGGLQARIIGSRFSLKHVEEEKWGRNPKCTNWINYKADLEDPE